ncbi:hypothetical protein CERSUDRAFT_85738 [Gelatoporia subvermispora B]|uniref:Uncharacterized protein n=1 Tax=Ceriporiopsis subvermispora (strain B) TaxID=914234 RepID=M2QSH1_CERS8|nr:hypothetical protein CERSUDRAFT_85738 [Gelatoporia subvermispora B]
MADRVRWSGGVWTVVISTREWTWDVERRDGDGLSEREMGASGGFLYRSVSLSIVRLTWMSAVFLPACFVRPVGIHMLLSMQILDPASIR